MKLIFTLLAALFFFSADSAALAYGNNTYHGDFITRMIAISRDGKIVRLHDGSTWIVSSGDQEEALRWHQEDPIAIKPPYSALPQLFRNYSFVFHNRCKNKTLHVNLLTPPSYGHYPHRVASSGPANYLTLNDGSIWLIDMSDHQLMPRNGQEVIIGVNNHWRTTGYPYILILAKPNTSEYLCAYFFGMVR